MSTFTDWIKNEVGERGWNFADLARQANLSKSTISMVMTETRRPGTVFCQAIAHALNLPENIVFEYAGLLNETRSESLLLTEANHLLTQLPQSDQEEIVEIIRLKIRMKNEKSSMPHHGRRVEDVE